VIIFNNLTCVLFDLCWDFWHREYVLGEVGDLRDLGNKVHVPMMLAISNVKVGAEEEPVSLLSRQPVKQI
jgi:hypothetical protein